MSRDRPLIRPIIHVFLSRYVSFRDEVTVDDVARGFEHAVRIELAEEIAAGERFACVTHSTGGPVVRHWWQKFYSKDGTCPMSHLIMLAPANFGSALAQLGKARLSRMKAWFDDVEPGTGVLDWLELGSPKAWALNREWVRQKKDYATTSSVFPFVLTGQTIDRKLYDHVNAYTGEPGSDDVVRVAAANLNATYVKLVQEATANGAGSLVMDSTTTSPETAFKIVPGRSHSGAAKGIMFSIDNTATDVHPTVAAIFRCLVVSSATAYQALRESFDIENTQTQHDERVDVYERKYLPDSEYVIDRFAMVIFLVRDDSGRTIGEFDLKITGVPETAPADAGASPDRLPTGFLQDRQRNRRDSGALTFFLNQDLMTGSDAVLHPRTGAVVRPTIIGLRAMGLEIEPHLDEGFAHYSKGVLEADAKVIRRFIKPNQTTVVEVVMRRIVRDGVLQLDPLTQRNDRSFARQPIGDPIQ